MEFALGLCNGLASTECGPCGYIDQGHRWPYLERFDLDQGKRLHFLLGGQSTGSFGALLGARYGSPLGREEARPSKKERPLLLPCGAHKKDTGVGNYSSVERKKNENQITVRLDKSQHGRSQSKDPESRLAQRYPGSNISG